MHTIAKLISEAAAFTDDQLVDKYGHRTQLIQGWMDAVASALRETAPDKVKGFLRKTAYYQDRFWDQGHQVVPADDAQLAQRRQQVKDCLIECTYYLKDL